MSLVIIALCLLIVALFLPRMVPSTLQIPSLILNLGRVVLVFFAVVMACSTSFNYIDDDEIGLISNIYGYKTLENGRILAANGEKGPQARVLYPGFNFSLFFNILNTVHKVPIVEIEGDKYGFLIAKDGISLRPNQTYADPFPNESADKMISDAEYFLKSGGQKGPQISVLKPGKYRMNRYLWDIFSGNITTIPVGMVGVVKSNAHAAVDFGNLKAAKPDNCDSIIDANVKIPLVPVGCIGIWSVSLPPGAYFINEKVYDVHLVDTRIQTWQYEGGFTRRSIDLTIDPAGKIEQHPKEETINIPEYAVDGAISLKVEGWTVHQQVRALVQVTPDKAAFVVASVGKLEEVEDRIITPTLQSILRNVAGSNLDLTETILNDDGTPKLDPSGNAILRTVTRPTKVLDFIENRDAIETEVERLVKIEGAKAGIDIKEVRLQDPDFPPELLLPRKRQQLAGQLTQTYNDEKNAQLARVETENAKATADQQESLVRAKIEVERQNQLALARKAEGQGQKDLLELTADGQKAQALVLGEDRVVELRKFDALINFADRHPEVIITGITNAYKFVPERIFTLGKEENSLPAAAGILGDFLGSKTTQLPIKQQ
jgi:regulator of protease activity HflC (stomatin/prohibitin superfamily)